MPFVNVGTMIQCLSFINMLYQWLSKLKLMNTCAGLLGSPMAARV